MPAPENKLKTALAAGKLQVGAWLGLSDAYVMEISAAAGFDWVTIDGEHSPNQTRTTLAQLQTLAGHACHAVARPVAGEAWMLKQLLDLGVQNIVVPMVESGDAARALVRAVRFPPRGIRGDGAAISRAGGFGTVQDYQTTADAQIMLLAQIESRAGWAALDDILAVDGIDGVFVGPSDLAADLGHLGRPNASEPRAAALDIVARTRRAGKIAGILSLDMAYAAQCVAAGATCVATAIDAVSFRDAMVAAAGAAQRLKS